MKNPLIVAARFASSNTLYHYFVPEGDNPKVGDYIITSTSWSVDTDIDTFIREGGSAFRDKFGVATVVDILTESERGNKFYIALISRDFLRERNKANKELMARAEVRKEAKRRLDQMLKEQSMIEVYRRLAAENKEAAELLRVLEG